MEEVRSMLGSLRLTKEEEALIKIKKDETGNREHEFDLVLVAKIMVARSIAPEILARTLKMAWRLKGLLEVSTYDSTVSNLFLVKFKEKEDKEWVMRNGPWSFDDKIIILAEVRKGEQIMDLNLHRTLIWCHILDLSMDWVTDSVGLKLGSAVGEVVGIQKKNCFFRVQAWVEVSRPLMRLIRAVDEGDRVISFPVQNENLPVICYQCGCLDHIKRDCRVTKEATQNGQKPYDNWLRYSP